MAVTGWRTDIFVDSVTHKLLMGPASVWADRGVPPGDELNRLRPNKNKIKWPTSASLTVKVVIHFVFCVNWYFKACPPLPQIAWV